MINLVTNAVKFTDQGSVTLELSIDYDTSPGVVTFSVRDTGMGIPLDEQDILFEEFKRTERATARGYGGMGLGLAICKKLVELGGGEIRVISSGEIGGGSCFTFSLPLPQDKDIHEGFSGSCVLLLRNGSNSEDTIANHLAQKGFEVKTASLLEVNKIFQQISVEPPGAIIWETEPSSENAWTLLSELKEHPRTREIPIMFYSVNEKNQTGDLIQLNYLSKPLSISKLRNIIEEQGLVGLESPRSILIVDDEVNFLEMHTRAIESQFPGAELRRASNGKVALEMMNKWSPELVLLDLLMPELDGFEVLEIMRSMPSLRSIPVIVLTSHQLSSIEIQKLNQGVAAILEKGIFTTDELLLQVESVLDRNKKLGGEARRIARKAMGYIHEFYGTAITRKDLAAYVGVSQAYFSTCFQKETGITPSTYIERYRIKQAKRLLENSDLSIMDVAMQVGFCDSSYFSRVFRRVIGISPMAYRKGEKRLIPSVYKQ